MGSSRSGGANFYGSLGGQAIPSPISAIAAPPSENGYWLAAQNGKIYNFGAAPALPALSLPSGAHIVGMASTQDGGGAWLTDQLGDVYAEGDALYEGGLGGVHINKPIVGIAAATSGQGYVLAASDGGAFNYGTQASTARCPDRSHRGSSLVAPSWASRSPTRARATGSSVPTAASSTTATPRSWARSTPPSATTRSTDPSSGSSTWASCRRRRCKPSGECECDSACRGRARFAETTHVSSTAWHSTPTDTHEWLSFEDEDEETDVGVRRHVPDE